MEWWIFSRFSSGLVHDGLVGLIHGDSWWPMVVWVMMVMVNDGWWLIAKNGDTWWQWLKYVEIIVNDGKQVLLMISTASFMVSTRGSPLHSDSWVIANGLDSCGHMIWVWVNLNHPKTGWTSSWTSNWSWLWETARDTGALDPQPLIWSNTRVFYMFYHLRADIQWIWRGWSPLTTHLSVAWAMNSLSRFMGTLQQLGGQGMGKHNIC